MHGAALALTVLGGVLQALGLLYAFKEVHALTNAAEAYTRSLRASTTSNAVASLRDIRLGGPSPERERIATAASRGAAADLVVSRLISPEGRRDRRRAAWLILGGLVCATVGSVLSLYA